MNSVLAVLGEHIANRNIRFVFPSQTASDLWARKTCTLGLVRSVAAGRFLAWDRFKEEVMREKKEGCSPSSQLMRKLFALMLLRKNAETPFLKSLVPPEYSGSGQIFVSFIARLLPSLAFWEKLRMKSKAASPAAVGDDEDRDYELLKREYSSFLERHGLFEPSWEELKIREGDERYVIFFPELIEDFAEYDALLTAPKFIRIKAEISRGRGCLVFRSAREEIRTAAMEMQRLHEKEGMPYEDMAVSVPELEEMEAYLFREFSLRHIPFTRRAGKKLGESGAGRLFGLVNEYAASGFSFNSLKALVLNDHIPWKDADINKKLIRFGIKYNCVSAYVQDGKTIDIWEEALSGAYSDGGRELRPYYKELKSRALAMAGSENFAELRKYYFAFRGSLLDMEKISAEDNAILSRCIEELSELMELVEKLNDPSLVPLSPFGFFLSCLKEKEYVQANQKPGVNIFRWRVAAAAPFGCHFVFNASQSAASVLYQPLKFLRQDKRKNLDLEDKDASGAFFSLYGEWNYGAFRSRTRISASIQAFSGWAIPHSFFSQGKTFEAPASQPDFSANSSADLSADPYRDERLFWRKNGAALKRIYPLQKKAYGLWKDALELSERRFSFFTSPLPADSSVRKLLESAVAGSEGNLVVTPTSDLNVYYLCAVKWLFKRVFGVDEFSLEAALLDDTALGLLYHKILEKLFGRIKKEDRVFDSRRLDDYKKWAFEITIDEIKEDPAFKGPLAVPLVSSQAGGMAKKIAGLLDLEAKNFDGYAVGELEQRVRYNAEGLLVSGVIDRVSLSPGGDPVIIDYKTRYLPDQTAMKDLKETPLQEFQMPLYVMLYEKEAATAEVKGAYFYSISEKKVKPAMGEVAGGKSKVPDREEYDAVLEAAEKQIEEFKHKVKALDFIPGEIKFTECLKCVYKTACRSVYNLNAAPAGGKERGVSCL